MANRRTGGKLPHGLKDIVHNWWATHNIHGTKLLLRNMLD
jgi:hypothetical protein